MLRRRFASLVIAVFSLVLFAGWGHAEVIELPLISQTEPAEPEVILVSSPDPQYFLGGTGENWVAIFEIIGDQPVKSIRILNKYLHGAIQSITIGTVSSSGNREGFIELGQQAMTVNGIEFDDVDYHFDDNLLVLQLATNRIGKDQAGEILSNVFLTLSIELEGVESPEETIVTVETPSFSIVPTMIKEVNFVTACGAYRLSNMLPLSGEAVVAILEFVTIDSPNTSSVDGTLTSTGLKRFTVNFESNAFDQIIGGSYEIPNVVIESGQTLCHPIIAKMLGSAEELGKYMQFSAETDQLEYASVDANVERDKPVRKGLRNGQGRIESPKITGMLP